MGRTSGPATQRPAIEARGDGLFLIFETEPVYGPRGGYRGKQFIYWGDAYPTEREAWRAIRVVEDGGCNPKPSIKVSIDTGDRI